MLQSNSDQQTIYAQPKHITSIDDCYFYHVLEIPGTKQVVGTNWDLRNGVDDYLGHTPLTGKRVLELGPASGFMTFQMEKRGAEVVCSDLSEQHDWDVVPMSQYDWRAELLERKKHIRQLNNGFWYLHRLNNSKAKVVYGPIYNIPEAVGTFDISLFGMILLHLRDPFLALQKGLSFTKEKAIITELMPDPKLISPKAMVKKLLGKANNSTPPYVQFLPDYKTTDHRLAWWLISPQAIQQMAGILGFEKSTVTYHQQKHGDRYVPVYTVVCERTRPLGSS